MVDRPAVPGRPARLTLICLSLVAGMSALVLALALLRAPVRAGSLCVAPGGAGGCAATITEALAVAQEGNLIQVAAGEYTEYVMITQTVTLQGGWAPDFSVRDLSQYTSTIRPPVNMISPQSVVSIHGQFADPTAVAPTLDGFLITGGRADLGSNHGGGLQIRNSNAQVLSNTIKNNRGFLLGGGIWVQNGAPWIEGNRIEDNLSDGLGQEAYGGGVQLENAQATLIDNMIAHNVVSGTGATGGDADAYGGGIDISGGQVLLAKGLVFSNTTTLNNPEGLGGGISVRSATVHISATVVSENLATAVGGGLGVTGGVVTVTASTLDGNWGFFGGGGVGAFDMHAAIDLQILNSTLSDNQALNGGGVFNFAMSTESRVVISNTTTGGNRAIQSLLNRPALRRGAAAGPAQLLGAQTVAGGLINYGSDQGEATAEIYSSEFSDNSAEIAGGVINLTAGDGTGVMLIARSAISANVATNGAAGGLLNTGNVATRTRTTLLDSAVLNNQAEDGAGILNVNAILSATRATIGRNAASANGGGVFNNVGGHMKVENSSIYDNEADSDANAMGDGGAIYNRGQISLIGTHVFSNTAASFGGGIFSDNALTVTHGLIHSNQADDGAGIQTEGPDSVTTVLWCTVRDNITAMGGGAGINNNGLLTIRGSTFSGNQAPSANGNGGGVLNNGEALIINSTVSGNQAGGFGGGIRNAGGMTLTNVTVHNNVGTQGAGGMQNMDAAMAINSVVAANSPDNCVGALTSLGHNLEDADTCSLDPMLNDLIGLDPALGGLAHNGGPTLTHALTANSPAIDAGDNAACPSVDQRGAARPVDGDDDGSVICDIGAFEYDPGSFGVYLSVILR